MRSLSCFYKSLFLTHTCSMLSRQLHTALAILVIGCCHCALSLPFSKSPRGLSPANSTLSERITSIFDERPHQSRLPLSQYAIASLGLAEAAALSQAAYCKSVRRLYWTCGTACSKYPDIYVQWTAGTSEKVPFSKLVSPVG